MGSQLGDGRGYLLGIYVNRCFMFSHIIALFLNINLNPIIGKYFSEDRVKQEFHQKTPYSGYVVWWYLHILNNNWCSFSYKWNFNIYVLNSFILPCAHMWTVCMWRSKDNLRELALSLCHLGPGDRTQVVGLTASASSFGSISLAHTWKSFNIVFATEQHSFVRSEDVCAVGLLRSTLGFWQAGLQGNFSSFSDELPRNASGNWEASLW